MVAKRTYGDACRVAHALDLVGERWALLVVRELLLGPKRFTDLRHGLPSASPNILAERLRELEAAGVIRRRTLPPPAGSKVYELTDWGRGLEPIITQLGAWGARAPVQPEHRAIGSDSIVLALRSLFNPGASEDLAATYELRLDGEDFRVSVAERELEIGRGAAADAEVTIETEAGVLAAVLTGELPLAEAVRSGALRVEGRKRAVAQFLRLFPMPEPAATAA